MILSAFQLPWVLPAALGICGLVFLADGFLSNKEGRADSVARFFLNVISLPLGAVTLLAAGLDVYTSGHVAVSTGIAIAVGLCLAGRSLSHLPWTGLVSLGAAAAVAWVLDRDSPVKLGTDTILAAAGLTFLVLYGILRLIELPMRVAAAISSLGPVLYVLAIVSWVGVGAVFLLGIG